MRTIGKEGKKKKSETNSPKSKRNEHGLQVAERLVLSLAASSRRRFDRSIRLASALFTTRYGRSSSFFIIMFTFTTQHNTYDLYLCKYVVMDFYHISHPALPRTSNKIPPDPKHINPCLSSCMTPTTRHAHRPRTSKQPFHPIPPRHRNRDRNKPFLLTLMSMSMSMSAFKHHLRIRKRQRIIRPPRDPEYVFPLTRRALLVPIIGRKTTHGAAQRQMRAPPHPRGVRRVVRVRPAGVPGREGRGQWTWVRRRGRVGVEFGHHAACSIHINTDAYISPTTQTKLSWVEVRKRRGGEDELIERTRTHEVK